MSNFCYLLEFQILAMVEEAAGTRMYESKKIIAHKSIEKKETKLNEIQLVLHVESILYLIPVKDNQCTVGSNVQNI